MKKDTDYNHSCYKAKPTHSSSGFTIVEISVAVAVISTIVTIAVFALGGSKADAQRQKRNANITAIENAKYRYILNQDTNITSQEASLNELSPYLSINGSPVQSLFDLVEGTGKTSEDLDLGSYGDRQANYGDLEGPLATSTTNPSASDIAYANEAQAILTGGGSWNDLSPEQKTGYSNVYPEQAVALGGTEALNSMDPSNLTPELIGFNVNQNGTWVSPYLNNSIINNTSFPYSSTNWAGWNQQFPIAVITNPLSPALIIGHVIPQYSPLMWVGTNPPPDLIGSKLYTAVISSNNLGITLTNVSTGSIISNFQDNSDPLNPTTIYNWSQVLSLDTNSTAGHVNISTPSGYPISILYY